jgi:hypothetical protein
MRPHVLVAVITMSILCAGAGPAIAADECTGFKWDVSKEHALFGGPSVTLVAGKDTASAPNVAINRLYLLQLKPQGSVSFALPPGKKVPAEDAYAGLAVLKLDAPGNYRVSVDVPLWIDVVANGKLEPPVDYQGQQQCSAPHKIVEFDLSDATKFVLQISSSTTTNVRVTVTPTPRRTI